VSENGELKSAYELAMERLRGQDREQGVEEHQPSNEQKGAIAEIRKFYAAKLAECEILHRSKLAVIPDPEQRESLESDYRRERERFVEARDAKIERIRKGED